MRQHAVGRHLRLSALLFLIGMTQACLRANAPGGMLLFGGGQKAGGRSAAVDIYDTATGRWSNATLTVRARPWAPDPEPEKSLGVSKARDDILSYLLVRVGTVSARYEFYPQCELSFKTQKES